MTEMTWVPSLLVLAAGLATGVWLALRFRQQVTEKEATAADLSLRIRDLEDRRDDLYRRLRAADEDNLSESERSSLVDAAARTLMELDRLQEQLPATASTAGRGQQDEAQEREDTPQEAVAAGATRQGRPLATGVLIGAAMVAVVALLVYFAVRDAKPTGQQPVVQTTAPGASEDPHTGQVGALPPELAAQVADLQARIVEDPEDWTAKKQLSLIMLSAGQFFEAFTLAGDVLQRSPEDPDALLVHGIVRVSMGQFEVGKDLLDRVLAEHPDHQQALLYRGLALYQLGQTEQAVDTWQIGLEMAGGSDPDFEELLAMAEAGVAIGGPQASSPRATPPNPTSTNIADGSYGIRLELAAGVVPTPGATLFVFLREEVDGPPIAVTRVVSPTFPLQISLSAADSMMGGEGLPERGILVAHLDGDGSVTTTEPGDLQALSAAASGELTTLVLGR